MKLTKVILVNVLIFLILFLLADILIFYTRFYISVSNASIWKEISYTQRIFNRLSKKYVHYIIFDDLKKEYRAVENPNSTKKPITLFGCSFAYGYKVKDNQTLSHILGELTGRPIYNRAICGWGIQHMLFQLESDEFYKIVPESEYVIYTYMLDHILRMYFGLDSVLQLGMPNFIYREKNDELVFDNYSNFIFHSALLSYIRENYICKNYTVEQRAQILEKHFLEAKKELDKHWENTKFVIFAHSYNLEILLAAKELRKAGIIIVTFDELTNGRSPYELEFTLSELDTHPNGRFWEVATPKLVEYLKNLTPERLEKSKAFDEFEINEFKGSKYEKVLDKIYRRSECYPESICFIDDQLIKNNEISKSKAYSAYTFWALGHLFKDQRYTNFLNPIAHKINPKNNVYYD